MFAEGDSIVCRGINYNLRKSAIIICKMLALFATMVIEQPRKRLTNTCLTFSIILKILLQVKPTDGLPHKICHCCILELKSAFSFRNKCDRSYNTLRSVDKSLSVVLGLPKARINSQMSVNSEEADSKCEDDFLEEECKDEKLIKIEFDDDSIDLPLEDFDCDIDQDEFLVERLADSEPVLGEIKSEPSKFVTYLC